MSLTVYTKNGCGYCDMLKMMLNKKEYEYDVINIDEDAEAKEFVINEGHRTMPQVYKDGELFVEGGFTGMKDYFDKEELTNTDLGSL